MPWVTALGKTLHYPTALHAKIARAARPDREDVLDCLAQVRRIHEEAQRMSVRIGELEAENLRLRHENEFMLRLVNARET
jgi:hypothetical protein